MQAAASSNNELRQGLILGYYIGDNDDDSMALSRRHRVCSANGARGFRVEPTSCKLLWHYARRSGSTPWRSRNRKAQYGASAEAIVAWLDRSRCEVRRSKR